MTLDVRCADPVWAEGRRQGHLRWRGGARIEQQPAGILDTQEDWLV